MSVLTAFGREVRRLRFEREETLREMAKALGVSAAFISAVETGVKSIPEGLIPRLVRHFKLDAAGRKRLEESVLASQKLLTIDLDEAGEAERTLAAEFARRFPTLSEEKKKQLTRLLLE
jgi:transcriptional regulator with XRE-family HTH domain